MVAARHLNVPSTNWLAVRALRTPAILHGFAPVWIVSGFGPRYALATIGGDVTQEVRTGWSIVARGSIRVGRCAGRLNSHNQKF